MFLTLNQINQLLHLFRTTPSILLSLLALLLSFFFIEEVTYLTFINYVFILTIFLLLYLDSLLLNLHSDVIKKTDLHKDRKSSSYLQANLHLVSKIMPTFYLIFAIAGILGIIYFIFSPLKLFLLGCVIFTLVILFIYSTPRKSVSDGLLSELYNGLIGFFNPLITIILLTGTFNEIYLLLALAGYLLVYAAIIIANICDKKTDLNRRNMVIALGVEKSQKISRIAFYAAFVMSSSIIILLNINWIFTSIYIILALILLITRVNSLFKTDFEVEHKLLVMKKVNSVMGLIIYSLALYLIILIVV